jgi:hypothetical protein
MIPRLLRSGSVSLVAVLALSTALGVSACKRSEEPAKAPPAPQAAAPQPVMFHVTRVDLGNAIGADKKVAAPATTFKPGDTIYASILTEGAAPNATLAVRWTFGDGQVVNEASQNIAPTGPSATEFHIAKPDGWPAGKYKVAVSADGKPAGGAEFTVAD